MNYNVEWTAKAVEAYLARRLRQEDEPEVPFQRVLQAIRALPEVDRTPEWVLLAALGFGEARGRIRVRVWKRDQVDPEELKVSLTSAAVQDARAKGTTPSEPRDTPEV